MTRPLHSLARSPSARDLLRAWEREGRSALELVEAVVAELGYEGASRTLGRLLPREARWRCECGHPAETHSGGFQGPRSHGVRDPERPRAKCFWHLGGGAYCGCDDFSPRPVSPEETGP